MTTATIYASATSKSLQKNSTTNYAGAHDAASGVVGGVDYIGQVYWGVATPSWDVYREALIFDLSSIPSEAIITAATMGLYGYLDESDTDFSITVVSGADLGATIVAADYGDLLDETTSYGALTTVGFALEAYNTITINATGIAAIQTAIAADVVRFGLRSSRDISNTTPKLNGATAEEYVQVYGPGETNKEPKLTLTYASPEGQGVLRVKGEYLDYLSRTGATRRAYGLEAPASHIGNPSGGGTQDAEARTAINAILVALENAKIVADA